MQQFSRSSLTRSSSFGRGVFAGGSNFLGETVLFLSFFLTIVMAGCSSVHTEPNPSSRIRGKTHWTFAKKAIRLHVTAPADLNRYHHHPHTLVIGIIQARNPNDLESLKNDPDAALDLLSSGEGNSAHLAIRRYIVWPGADQGITLDRLRKTMYLGIIAGYSGYGSRKDFVMLPIPVEVRKSGIIFKSRSYRPAPSGLSIILGRSHVVRVAPVSRTTGKQEKTKGKGKNAPAAPIQPIPPTS